MVGPPVLIAIYLLFCALVGFAGRGTRVGALGMFLLAVIFTPLLVGIILAIVRPSPRPRRSG